MYNAQQVMTRLGLPNSPTAAVVIVGDTCRDDRDTIGTAVKWIEDITGVRRSFTDKFLATMTAQACAEAMVRAGDTFDPLLAIIAAEDRASKFRNNPKNRFLFEQDSGTVTSFTVTKEVSGINIEVKANGKIKKGGKNIAADALYLQHVINGGMSFSDYKKELINQLDMSAPGASTYAQNARSKYNKEHGIVVTKE